MSNSVQQKKHNLLHFNFSGNKQYYYSLGVPVSQSSTKLRETYFKENLFLGILPKVSPDLMIRYDTYFFSYNFVLRAQP